MARSQLTSSDWLIRIAWGCYILSLASPTLSDSNLGYMFGAQLLVWAPYLLFKSQAWAHWWGLLALVSWATNVLFWTTWAAYGSAKVGRTRGMQILLPAAVLANISVVALATPRIRTDLLSGVLANPGYYLWLSSFVIAIAAIVTVRARVKPAI